MKFLVCKKQHGEGCDYTIGCGYLYEWYTANSVDEIVNKVVWPDGMDESSSLEGESALEEILIIPESSVLRVDILGLKKKVETFLKEKADLDLMKDELAQLKHLQEKYRKFLKDKEDV
ncbi:MAG: hypothetical protein PVG39_07935 [Desulfobacteraceae bacterium]|jgi:hypothetical protein